VVSSVQLGLIVGAREQHQQGLVGVRLDDACLSGVGPGRQQDAQLLAGLLDGCVWAPPGRKLCSASPPA
jgi:hypothetical protein